MVLDVAALLKTTFKLPELNLTYSLCSKIYHIK